MSHTPGPWKFDEEWRCVVDPTNTMLRVSGVSLAMGYVPIDDESYANALLIAAAPRLLAALEGLVADLDEAPFLYRVAGAYEQARAAIAAAKGER